METLSAARALFLNAFEIAPPLVNRINGLREALFGGRFMLGVHYRGTDKKLEAERVPYETVLESVRAALDQAALALGGEVGVFIATDEAAFAEAALRSLAPFTVVTAPGAQRSLDGKPIHQSKRDCSPGLAEQAMIDCLLLSHCDAILKTPSMLSGWATLLSGRPTLMWGSPKSDRMFFPDSLVLRQAYVLGNERQLISEALADRTKEADRASRSGIAGD
ncbi:MAG TPA: hypothetical protein VHF69_09365 [Candidatus Synoicihabitans sp.]|nr:hypothetical protein [Candidatus Synoicihabitans sp.]